MNKDKWLGVGGKFIDGESPEECLLREVKEETGLTLNNYQLRGVITYTSTVYDTEYMYLFTSNDFEGELIECNEGILQWISKCDVIKLDTWQGDKIFLEKLIKDNNFFTIKFEYDGENLIKYDLKEYKY